MRETMRWLGVIVGGLALLVVMLFASARLMGPGKEQQTALALLDDKQPRPGRNAFALLWLMPYDVPEAERERVLADDVRRFNRAPAPSVEGDRNYTGFKSSAAERYPAQDKVQRGLYCTWHGRDCLTKIRAQPQAYSQQFAKDAAVITRADSLSHYGHVRNLFSDRLDTPLPP